MPDGSAVRRSRIQSSDAGVAKRWNRVATVKEVDIWNCGVTSAYFYSSPSM